MEPEALSLYTAALSSCSSSDSRFLWTKGRRHSRMSDEGKVPAPPQLPTTPLRVAVSSSSKRTVRKSIRPATAPPQHHGLLLPSLPNRHFMGIPDSSSEYTPSHYKNKARETTPYMQTVDENDSDRIFGLGLGSFPSPFDWDSDELNHSPIVDGPATNQSDCDWATFIIAYASGRWDPLRTPNPPRPFFASPCAGYLAISTSPNPVSPDPFESGVQIDAPRGVPSDSLSALQATRLTPAVEAVSKPESTPAGASTLSVLTPSLPVNRFRASAPFKIPLPAYRMRNSFSTSSAPSPGKDPVAPNSSPHSNAELQTAAAAMRWAAARVDISPLALPSPEHELTDPMRGIMATVPYTPEINQPDHPPTPGAIRKSRSFWHGTTDVENDSSKLNVNSARLATIEATPEAGVILNRDSNHQLEITPSISILPFIRVIPHPHSATSPTTSPPGLTGPSTPVDYFDYETQDSNSGTMSAPVYPRRICLTRPTSSPLPVSRTREAMITGGRVVPDSGRAGRAVKEEQMYVELGYLAPPNPPDELERRRALYKFNIWNTGPDLNFDRIAHLAKLVFNTKYAAISMVDSNEQWSKAESGLIDVPSSARMSSFPAHAILQRGDEPMVVLDTHLDWRFAKNPLVRGEPRIRFFAGAPLRTQDGFNLGTLAVSDDAPREDFSPRQRHTLKEFAAIAMREMELWRDKVQLRIRDRIQNSMEQFTRECLEIDTEPHGQQKDSHPELIVGSSMDKVYDRAAKLVKRTLDVESVIVMDISHREVLESMSAEGSVSITMHHGDPQVEATQKQLAPEEYRQLDAFFAKYPEGKISEGILPTCFRTFLPTHIQYALTVPIFNIDKRPFALLCAFNVSDQTRRYLEGHELSYLRAIGVIILSAVLKRRMILADKAKSMFISNISHELRTPLHGILAAAELLSDSHLNHSQLSFLQTVQACGNSLVETVNHVLDFTKLSGNSKAGGVENVIVTSKVDLMQLVEEAVDGCWIGHRARTAPLGDSGIGSVYSPPNEDQGSPVATRRIPVETVVDIGHRPKGWFLKCEKGGIRRVLMNLFGNSLKFTASGFVHVMLRELRRTEDEPPNKVKIELAVLDTGKGISQNFLKNQLFHPFSQENPLQAGTGLGLAIVNSIVTSESVGGKVEVWSEEGVGTDIKVTFSAERSDNDDGLSPDMEPLILDGQDKRPTVSLVGFDTSHQGVKLLRRVLQTYLTSWWGFELHNGDDYGDIVILNDDPSPVFTATERRDTIRSFVILSASRGNPTMMVIANNYERIGGFCRILYKPGGPSRLRSILKLSLHAFKIGSQSRDASPHRSWSKDHVRNSSFDETERSESGASIPRRNSEESHHRHPHRPAMSQRSTTAHPNAMPWQSLSSTAEAAEIVDPDTVMPTITVGTSGSLLRSSIGTVDKTDRKFRVLVVEDNNILRNLLMKWLSNKGYDFRDAIDGRDGVSVYQKEGPFDVVLLDLSMPVLDGVSATVQIRQIESAGSESSNPKRTPPTRILALTGMSSLEDKRRAFEAGVDGYLVKPVAFKTLDEMFHKLGIS